MAATKRTSTTKKAPVKKDTSTAAKTKPAAPAKKKTSYNVVGGKKKRVMTEEQKQAAAERLAAARAKKGHDGSASVHPDLRDVPEDNALHWKKVKEWIKDIGAELANSKAKRDSKDSKDRQWYQTQERYLGNLKKYLETGVYLDDRYGRLREGIMTPVCHVMAYDEDGDPKRNVGTWYKDIADIWTKEMDETFKRMKQDDRKGKRRQQLLDEEEIQSDD